MVEPIMLITTHELQHGKDHSPYLLGNVDFFFYYLNLVMVLFLCCCLVGARTTTVLFLVSISLKMYHIY